MLRVKVGVAVTALFTFSLMLYVPLPLSSNYAPLPHPPPLNSVPATRAVDRLRQPPPSFEEGKSRLDTSSYPYPHPSATLYESGMYWITRILGYVVDGVIMFGVIFVYYPQYNEIVKTSNPFGFSMAIPFILLTSNTLRICYWFGARYAIPLLIQAIVTIIVQLVMLHLCVRLRDSREPQRKRHILDIRVADFWSWSTFDSYVIFLSVFTICATAVTASTYRFSTATNVLGYIALGIEGTLPIPQLVRNQQRRSTVGLSTVMVTTWLLSDLAKTAYFLSTGAPIPFAVCGCFQCVIDFLIILQIRSFNRTHRLVLTLSVDDANAEKALVGSLSPIADDLQSAAL